MSNTYDIIVIGGGHNGLTTATALAKKNKKVLLLEKRPVLGGVAAGEEFYPGYSTSGLLHDTSGLRPHVIKTLELEKSGLKTKKTRTNVSILSKDGKCLELSADVDATVNAISKFSQKDAEGYRGYRAFVDSVSGFIRNLLDEFPPDLTNLAGAQWWALAKKGLALKKLGNRTMMELLKVAPMSVADFLNEKFETDFIKAGIAGPAIYGSFTGPRSSYTTLNLLLWECTAYECVVGGPQALVSALEHAARNAGVEIRTNAPVENITLDKNRKVTGVRLFGGKEINTSVVASTCTPRVTFYELLKPNQISYTLEHGIKHYRSRGTTAKVNLAMNRLVAFNGVDGVEFARTGNSLDEMERAFDPVKYRTFSDEPVLDIHVPSVQNVSLAPAGHAVMSILVHFVPYKLDEGWSAKAKEKLLNNVIRALSYYVPEISSMIIASEVLTPADLEARYSLTNGHIYHGEHAVDQLITRPIPSCSRYTTPIAGLYLCGSGSHPGGGITCMPGYLGAQMILQHS